MNPTLITTLTTVAASFAALWTILANFDRRNGARFDSLQRQIDATQKQIEATRVDLQKEIQASKEVLRAEMREMRAEIRLEIKEAADRRLTSR